MKNDCLQKWGWFTVPEDRGPSQYFPGSVQQLEEKDLLKQL
ncbi:hypothetical protein AAEO50_13530 [Rossellomorea oryzaecorticis]|uniref:Uncharacterized protein n=1 Tax=Rossellomorea oryzaecorticis TaxID=1396505 RepID=A0ABU9KBA2_9BACI